MIARQIKFTSVYEDGDEVEVLQVVEVPNSLERLTEEHRQELLEELLYPLTGTGREQGHACYWAESVDGIEPAISVEWC